MIWKVAEIRNAQQVLKSSSSSITCAAHCPVGESQLQTETGAQVALWLINFHPFLHKRLLITFGFKLSHDSDPVFCLAFWNRELQLVLPVVAVTWTELAVSHCSFSGIHWVLVVYYSTLFGMLDLLPCSTVRYHSPQPGAISTVSVMIRPGSGTAKFTCVFVKQAVLEACWCRGYLL